MKIVMFTDAYWPRVNGVTVSVDSFSHALVRRGNEVMIVCPFYPESPVAERLSTVRGAAPEHESEPVVVRVPSIGVHLLSKEDRFARFEKLFWVSQHIEAFNPDILHINTEFMLAEFGLYYAGMYGIPSVYTFHTLWEDYATNYLPFLPPTVLKSFAKNLIKKFLRRANRVIVPTEQIGGVIKQYGVKKRTHLVPTGIDPALFTHDDEEITAYRTLLEQKYPRLRGKRILLFAGRISGEKNIDFLLAIAPLIIEKHPEIAFLFVGNGPDLHLFQKEAVQLGVADACVFTGYLSREDLALTYGMSDIFVFPSLTETQGLVTIEAMLSGTPVVAIGAMGTLTVMGGDNGGFMVKNDKDEFVRRVFELLEDDELYQRKVAEAREHAQAWTIDTMAVKLEKIYQGTIDAFQRAVKNNTLFQLRNKTKEAVDLITEVIEKNKNDN
ncbi:MAG: glycosyltransferase [Treponema sp.]|jgi:glycosyltransferase involved in cell wall biosynthesis|nr:glycosyltransferase [Treponema sp.]